MSCLSSSCRTCRSTSQRLQLQYPIHSCHFSTCRPTQTDTSSSKLPARDWSKYVFTPARPILSEARPAIPREDPRKTNDRVKRGPPGPRPTIGLNGELKTPLGQYRNQRVPIGLSKWGLSQDRGQKENREAPEHFGFGLKRPVQPGQRSAWADRGRADRVPLDGKPRNTRSSP